MRVISHKGGDHLTRKGSMSSHWAQQLLVPTQEINPKDARLRKDPLEYELYLT